MNRFRKLNNVFSWVFLTAMIGFLVFSIISLVNVKGTDEPVFILGHRLIYLTSGSMEPTIKTNALSVSRRVDSLGEIEVGDVVSFKFVDDRDNKTYRATQTIEKRIKTILDLILEKTGIKLTFITPHYFRHTFATTGLNNGSTISDMMALMEHKKFETLMQYNHKCTTSIINSSNNIAKILLRDAQQQQTQTEPESQDKWSISGQNKITVNMHN